MKSSASFPSRFTADTFAQDDAHEVVGQSSVDSSRRNSLAPLPDVDDYADDGDRFQLRDLDEAELFRRSVSVEQPMPRPRRLGISGGKPITQVHLTWFSNGPFLW